MNHPCPPVFRRWGIFFACGFFKIFRKIFGVGELAFAGLCLYKYTVPFAGDFLKLVGAGVKQCSHNDGWSQAKRGDGGTVGFAIAGNSRVKGFWKRLVL